MWLRLVRGACRPPPAVPGPPPPRPFGRWGARRPLDRPVIHRPWFALGRATAPRASRRHRLPTLDRPSAAHRQCCAFTVARRALGRESCACRRRPRRIPHPLRCVCAPPCARPSRPSRDSHLLPRILPSPRPRVRLHARASRVHLSRHRVNANSAVGCTCAFARKRQPGARMGCREVLCVRRRAVRDRARNTECSEHRESRTHRHGCSSCGPPMGSQIASINFGVGPLGANDVSARTLAQGPRRTTPTSTMVGPFRVDSDVATLIAQRAHTEFTAALGVVGCKALHLVPPSCRR